MSFSKGLYLIFIPVIIIWGLSFLLPKDLAPERFSIIETLFSGMAFAGVIVTVILQSKELQLQRKELAETREEFKEQNETLRKQRFENTFFQLVSAYSNAVTNFAFTTGVDTSYGSNAIRSFSDNLTDSLNRVHRKSPELKPLDELSGEINHDIMTKAFNSSPSRHLVQTLGAIFWRGVEFIHNSKDISDVDKQFYSRILLSLVSDYDLRVIFYDYFFSDSEKSSIELIAYYNIFWRIKPNSVVHRSHYEYYQNELKIGVAQS